MPRLHAAFLVETRMTRQTHEGCPVYSSPSSLKAVSSHRAPKLPAAITIAQTSWIGGGNDFQDFRDLLAFFCPEDTLSAMDVNESTPESREAEWFPTQVSSFWVRLVIGRRPRTTFIRLIVLVLTTLILFGLVFLPIRVSGNSMAPTYKTGRVNLVNRLSYHWSEPHRADVVAIRMAGIKVLLLKRIIGLPGKPSPFTGEPCSSTRSPWTNLTFRPRCPGLKGSTS